PQVFLQAEQPQLEVQINNDSTQFAEGMFEVTVSVTVTARAGERTIFLAEVVQAGIFVVRGVPQAELDPLLAIGCPTVLYPYVRETVSDLVSRGGFPPVLLALVSFEALHAQRAQQQAGGPQSRIELPS
ncbi:MAG: protein-export chaperone SecB, partial [Burkholderiales bacterium]